MGFRVWGLGFRVWGLGFGVWGLGFRVWGLGVLNLGFGALSLWYSGLRFRLQRGVYLAGSLPACFPGCSALTFRASLLDAFDGARTSSTWRFMGS